MKSEILDYLEIKIGKTFIDNLKAFDISSFKHSVKITEDEYIDGRILLEIKNNIEYSIFQFRNVIESLTQNKLLIEMCSMEFIDCDIFKIEFEIKDDDILCVVYFENEMTDQRKKNIKSKRLIRGETATSYAWNINSYFFTTSKYEQVIKLNSKILLNYVFKSNVNEFYTFSANQQVLKNINSLRLLSCENVKSKSIDIKLKRALSTFDITPKVRSIHKKENLYNKLQRYERMKIYHINFGMDKIGKKYFILYFEPYAILPQIN